jgi:hypothetical protein
VIIGEVREEISIDRLMQDAQQDIVHEMQKAEAEDIDEKEKVKRIAHLLSSKRCMCNKWPILLELTQH